MEFDIFIQNQDRHARKLLGLYIHRKRAEMGFSMDEVSSQVSLTLASYQRIENGQKKMNKELFRKIQRLLKLEPEDLAEIRKIAAINYVNQASKLLALNYPV